MPAVEQDLTQGSVTRKLVRYALPLVASSLLQAIYSITDITSPGTTSATWEFPPSTTPASL